MADFDRYSMFRSNGQIGMVPFGKIPKHDTDFFESYRRGETRLDILSNNYYNSSDYAWLIMQANPQYGSLEFKIPDGAEIRIPYPLGQSLQEYQDSLIEHRKLYG